MNDDWIGYRWLAKEFGVETVQSFPTSSRIGRSRSSTSTDGFTVVTHLGLARPESTLSGHLTFALKHEGVHLEFLARLFAVLPPALMNAWVNGEPSGQYARRAGFLYEWLTSKQLDFGGVQVGNYVLALPAGAYVTRSRPTNNARWRVRNNLPGLATYCPTIRRTRLLADFEAYDCLDKLRELEVEFGADIFLRSAVWLTIKESRSSFMIEHEEAQTDRIKRFASVMERYLGEGVDPLADEFLARIQSGILGERALRLGLRRSPVFIGETGRFGEVVHYVAPHWDDVPAMLEGLREFATATEGGWPAIIRGAALSFGFVYIHPMVDGNGRISRFLVNDTFRRDGEVPSPYILPISATITRSVANRAAYDQVLEFFSKPLMNRYSAACSFGAVAECDDGIQTNFRFSAYDEARYAWTFPDLTHQCEYMAGVIKETIESEMRKEASFLADIHRTRAKVKEVIEAPDVEIDRLIRSIRNNKRISGRLISEFPFLEDGAISNALLDAILPED